MIDRDRERERNIRRMGIEGNEAKGGSEAEIQKRLLDARMGIKESFASIRSLFENEQTRLLVWTWEYVNYDKQMLDALHPVIRRDLMKQTLLPIDPYFIRGRIHTIDDKDKQDIRYLRIEFNELASNLQPSLADWDNIVQEFPNLAYVDFENYDYCTSLENCKALVQWASSRELRIRGLNVGSKSDNNNLDAFKLGDLRRLAVRDTRLSPTNLDDLLESKNLRILEYTESDRDLTSVYLSQLFQLPLERIYIRPGTPNNGTAIDDDCIKQLLGHQHLASIYITDSNVGPEGVKMLLSIPTLRSAVIHESQGHQFTDEEIRELKSLRPDVKLSISNGS